MAQFGLSAEDALTISKKYTEKTIIGEGALKGNPGKDGADGKSAYQSWLDLGNTGTEQDFINSLKGANGKDGTDGANGQPGEKGDPGQDGENGKSAYDIWIELGNTGTEEDFLNSLKGEPGEKGADGTMSFEDLTDEQKDSLKGTNGKSAYEIWLDEGNTGTEEDFLESLKGDGADIELDDTPTEDSENAVKSGGVFNALKNKQDIISDGESGQILVKHYNTPGSFKWADHTNFVIKGEVSFPEGGSSTVSGITPSMTYSLAKYALSRGKKIVMELTDRDTGLVYHLYLVRVTSYSLEFETHLRDNDLIESVYFTMTESEYYTAKRIVREYMQKVNGTLGQIIGFDENGKPVAQSFGDGPLILECTYTSDYILKDKPTIPYSEWYPQFVAGRQVMVKAYLETIGANEWVMLYPSYWRGSYVKFTSLYSESPKYIYRAQCSTFADGWGFTRMEVYEIPTGGTKGQVLVKNSDTYRDVKWADPTTGGLVVTGNYDVEYTGDGETWTVSNIDKTFEEINGAITSNQDVVLKIYPVGDTTNPYILYPAMHYSEMGTAFALSLCDEGQVLGLNVMITKDNQVTASRIAHDFEEFVTNESLNTALGGKEVKILNNQYGDVTKLFRITDAPSESGKCYTVKLVAQRKNATAHTECLTVSRINDNYTFESSIELQEKNVSTGEPVTMENANFLIVDANYELWAHIPSYSYAYVELISPNAKGTFVIDGSEGEFAEDAVLDTFSKRETDTFAKKGELDVIKKSVSDGKTLVAGAITSKGFETAADAEFATMAENIGKIEAPVIELKYSEGTKDLFSSYVASITAGSNTFVAWGYADKSMYYSEDGGKTWQLSNLTNLTSLNAPTIIYAKEYDIFAILLSATGHGVYISQDGGKTWTLQMGYSNVNTLAYSNGIFVGCSSNTTSGGITYSPDGVYWSLNANFSSKAITNLKCVNNRWFFVCDGTTYTSADGYNWTALTGTVSGSKFTNIIYYQGVWLASASGSSTTVFYSNDGVTWNACAFNWSNSQYGNSIQALSRIGNTYVASTYNGMYYSTDRGKTWNASNITAGNHKLQLFAGKLLALGNNGPGSGKGVYTSADGKTWTQATTFPNASNTNGKVFIKDGKILVTGSDSALYVSSNGDTWTKVEDSCTLHSEFNGILIAKQFKYSMDGINWKSIKPADTTQTLAEYYYFVCNTILACSSPLGVYYSKAYFS